MLLNNSRVNLVGSRRAPDAHSSNLIERMPNQRTVSIEFVIINIAARCVWAFTITIGLSFNQINQSDGVAAIINWKLDNNQFCYNLLMREYIRARVWVCAFALPRYDMAVRRWSHRHVAYVARDLGSSIFATIVNIRRLNEWRSSDECEQSIHVAN